MEQKQPLQQMVLGDLDSYVQNNETRSPAYAMQKINSRWIKDLNLSSIKNAIKVLEENIGSKISYIPCSNIFANISLTAKEMKEKMNEWDCIKLKSLCTAKENIIKMKRDPRV